MLRVLLTHSFHLNKSGESFFAPKPVEFPLDFVKDREDMTRERERTKIISRWHPVSCQINSSKEQAYQQRRNQTLERKVWPVKVIHWLLQCGWPCGSGKGMWGLHTCIEKICQNSESVENHGRILETVLTSFIDFPLTNLVLKFRTATWQVLYT